MTQIEASHFDVNTAYVSVSRLRVDDLHPYIYRTVDGGKSWQSLSRALPDAPVNAVREDPQRRGLLYAATENAVWISFDDGQQWQSLQLNLPHTSMRDLIVHDNDLVLATHGRSIWILDDISRLRQLPAAALHEVTLFRPATATRVQRSTWPGERDALAQLRRACLDELERRDPCAFARWLATARAAGDPGRFFGRQQRPS